MSVLNEALSLLGSVWDFLYNIVGSGIGFISGLFAIVGTTLKLLFTLFTLIEIVVYIIFNPFLILYILVGTGLYYASFRARTRKELIIYSGQYYYNVFVIYVPRALIGMYNIALQLAQILSNAIVSFISALLNIL